MSNGVFFNVKKHVQRFLRSLRTDSDQYRTGPYLLDLHQSRADFWRSISTLQWYVPVFEFGIDRHRLLESRYEPAQTGSRLSGLGPVWAGWCCCRCGGQIARNAVTGRRNMIMTDMIMYLNFSFEKNKIFNF